MSALIYVCELTESKIFWEKKKKRSVSRLQETEGREICENCENKTPFVYDFEKETLDKQHVYHFLPNNNIFGVFCAYQRHCTLPDLSYHTTQSSQ
jgi:hypothetical protein